MDSANETYSIGKQIKWSDVHKPEHDNIAATIPQLNDGTRDDDAWIIGMESYFSKIERDRDRRISEYEKICFALANLDLSSNIGSQLMDSLPYETWHEVKMKLKTIRYKESKLARSDLLFLSKILQQSCLQNYYQSWVFSVGVGSMILGLKRLMRK